jgi:hypothetical protein
MILAKKDMYKVNCGSMAKGIKNRCHKGQADQNTIF